MENFGRGKKNQNHEKLDYTVINPDFFNYMTVYCWEKVLTKMKAFFLNVCIEAGNFNFREFKKESNNQSFTELKRYFFKLTVFN